MELVYLVIVAAVLYWSFRGSKKGTGKKRRQTGGGFQDIKDNPKASAMALVVVICVLLLYFYWDEIVYQDNCAVDTVRFFSDCENCTPGYTQNTENGPCSECDLGYTKDAEGKCVKDKPKPEKCGKTTPPPDEASGINLTDYHGGPSIPCVGRDAQPDAKYKENAECNNKLGEPRAWCHTDISGEMPKWAYCDPSCKDNFPGLTKWQ